MYKGILLDIDNTLYQYEPIHALAQQAQFDYMAKTFALPMEEIQRAYSAAKSQVKSRLPAVAASHNRLLYAQSCCELLGLDALSHSMTLYNIYWDTFLTELKLTEGAQTFFNHYGHLPICLLTDLTAHIQHRKVAKLELMTWANHIVTSEEAGCEKPHPYMFDLGLRKLNLRSNEVCMVGDNYKKDILGAQQLGINSFWLTDKETQQHPTGIIQVKSLGDIKW